MGRPRSARGITGKGILKDVPSPKEKAKAKAKSKGRKKDEEIAETEKEKVTKTVLASPEESIAAKKFWAGYKNLVKTNQETTFCHPSHKESMRQLSEEWFWVFD